ncbi:MAG: tetratricopeptide repeat protein [Gammaproteobacteria bacterium]
MRHLATVILLTLLAATTSAAVGDLTPYHDQIEQGYNARDSKAIDAAVEALHQAGKTSGEEDLASYYTAFARLRQSAIPGIPKNSARDYLEQCIDELEPLLERRSDYAQARALYASCLGASSSYYVLRAATRGIAAGREMSAAVKLAPDNPWVVFQDAVSDFHTPTMFGGDKERALGKLQRAAKLFVAARPAGTTTPVFGESETGLYTGRVYLALGQTDKARAALQKAQTLAPDSADVRDELAKLR